MASTDPRSPLYREQPHPATGCSLDCEDGDRSLKEALSTSNQRQLKKLAMRCAVAATLGAMMGTIGFFAVGENITKTVSKDAFVSFDLGCIKRHASVVNSGSLLAAHCELPSPYLSPEVGSLAKFAAKFALAANPVPRSARLRSPPVFAVPSSGQRIARIASPQMAADTKVDAKMVKTLRDATGAGMMDCKKALVENDGNVDAAMEFLRKKGLASAEKKASRQANQGIIGTYVHTGAQLGVMVEINCETDFVAKNPEFTELAKTLAMQIAASPTVEVVSEEDIPTDLIEKERKIESASEDLKGKPEDIINKIVEGRINKLMKTKILLEQPFIRDNNMNVDEFVKSYVAKLGENIQVRRFTRFNVGGAIAGVGEDATAEKGDA